MYDEDNKLTIPCSLGVLWLNPSIEDNNYVIKKDHFIMMEFAGLTDNNGTESKEVYDGDILYNSDRNEYQEVIYNEDEARWDVRYSHGEQRSLADAIGNLNTVAGNIFQNKDLI